MPTLKKYRTGGLNAPKNYLPGEGENTDVDLMAANMGNNYGGPNSSNDKSGPGGYGSTGSRSSSNPKGDK